MQFYPILLGSSLSLVGDIFRKLAQIDDIMLTVKMAFVDIQTGQG